MHYLVKLKFSKYLPIKVWKNLYDQEAFFKKADPHNKPRCYNAIFDVMHNFLSKTFANHLYNGLVYAKCTPA